ncbi:RING finger domain protein (Znf1), putative [Aspergillus fumigatus A1163]|uniref:RING finger domain protein (Znf1), putative n=2 Tax=Aspergillus fumigatus TaxID=746128 RepID=Q4WNQ1_ASPFU|nr:RING finger domain protein (Znf1), putative [Aspergillus fumigatus Af293]EAL90133.1 RING finger domain protein (Znf1), putative [Aspergillus fumigatus Af293]EDP50032.1 RING finger domain protein (Znf1), putative [Aspergillus fumigatus A1163]KEY78718.1 RING finger Znf1 [Aspergillus fumigatus]
MGSTRTTASCQIITGSSPARGRMYSVAPGNTRSATKRKRDADDDIKFLATPVKNARRRVNPTSAASAGSTEVIDLTADSPATTPTKKTRSPKKRLPGQPAPERRARPFRFGLAVPLFVRCSLTRPLSRMCVVEHCVTEVDDAPEVVFTMAGTTGNLYKVVIGKVPSCDCPDGVLINALKAPAHLQYQLAFLSSELREMYQSSPLSSQKEQSEDNNGKRKPIEGDCPICFMELEPEKDEIVWCRAACGNNVHKACFRQWAATQNAQGVRCVYCRSAWETGSSELDLKQLTKDGYVNEEGYVNVGHLLGMPGERGTRPSLYLSP